LKKVKTNKQKTMNFVIEKVGESRNSYSVKVEGVGVESMTTLPKVGALV